MLFPWQLQSTDFHLPELWTWRRLASKKGTPSSTCSWDRCHLTSWTEEQGAVPSPTSHDSRVTSPPSRLHSFYPFIPALPTLRKPDLLTPSNNSQSRLCTPVSNEIRLKSPGFSSCNYKRPWRKGGESKGGRIITLAGKAHRHQSRAVTFWARKLGREGAVTGVSVPALRQESPLGPVDESTCSLSCVKMCVWEHSMGTW